jgi:hypothetical protein
MATLIGRAWWAGIALTVGAAALTGCAGTAHRASLAKQPGGSASVPQSAPRPGQTATPGSVPGVIELEASTEVPFTGDQVSFDAYATSDSFTGRWPLAQATLDFGDGSSLSVSGACAGQSQTLTANHVYRSVGDFTITVTSARPCDSSVSLDEHDIWPAVLVMPSAPAGSGSWPECGQGQVQVSAQPDGAAVSNRTLLFTIRNVSGWGCTAFGYPGLVLVGQDGTALPANVARGGAYLFPSVQPHLVALAPGGVASFDVGYSIAELPDCQVAQAEVFLPGSYTYSLAGLDELGQAFPCHGQFSITPVLPGSNGVSFP